MKYNDSKPVKYIFSINPGRSGSHYLSKIFSFAKNCRAFHEAPPVGNARAMRQFFNGNQEPMRSVARKKAHFIKQQVAMHATYVETNHCFIKGFGWHIAEYLNASADEIGVVVLKRGRKKVVESTHRIGCKPLNQVGRNWILTPDVKRAINTPPSRLGMPPRQTYKLFKLLNYPFSGVAPFATISKAFAGNSRRNSKPAGSPGIEQKAKRNRPANDDSFRPTRPITNLIRDYELSCLGWYYDEVYALYKRFRKRFPGFKYYHATLDDLNIYDKVIDMMHYFGLAYHPHMIDSINRSTNRDTQTRK